MLRLSIVVTEGFDESTNQFVEAETVDVELEHSLVSLSKWESKYEVPFLEGDNRTGEEMLDYIRFMILGEPPAEDVFKKLSAGNVAEIERYINAKMTATWFSEDPPNTINREIVTAEIVYYWMVALNIPFECQHWHLNRLMTLIKVCNLKNQPKKSMSRAESAAWQSELNAQRRAKLHSTG